MIYRVIRAIRSSVSLIIIRVAAAIYRDNKAFIVGSPIHGNLGDQAIIQSEINFFKKQGLMAIEIESHLAKTKIKVLKKVIGNYPIYIHGGGFIGTLWPEEEEMLREIIKNFPRNKIVVLPQTCYFDSYSSAFYRESKGIYESNKNIIFIMREKNAYNRMKKYFSRCKITLVPDMVLSEIPTDSKLERNGVLFCFRNDKEKIFNEIRRIEDIVRHTKLPIRYTDTVIKDHGLPFNRKKVLTKKLNQFSKSQLVITDRLHGMVFAYLTMTPCIAIDNKSHKVKGLYDWISKSNYVKIYDKNTFELDVDELLNLKNKEPVELSRYFDELVKIINYCESGIKNHQNA